MQCPRQCPEPLKPVRLADMDVTIHLCTRCEGAWYPRGCLADVGQSPPELIAASDLVVCLVGDKLEIIDQEAEVACPECAQTMNRFSYALAPKIKLDECQEHGTWLDDGELGAMLQAIEESSAEMARYREGIEDMRKKMDIEGIIRGTSPYNPFALTLRLLHSLFSRS